MEQLTTVNYYYYYYYYYYYCDVMQLSHLKTWAQ